MLIIDMLKDERISIKANYYYSSRIRKSVPDAVFDYAEKKYIIEKKDLPKIESNFKGELYYKTPRWIIMNESAPDMTKMYQITDDTIQAPKLKLKPYDYQEYGIRFMIDKILQNGFVLNSDDVGLGKTLMTIGTLKWFVEHQNIKKILIVCKKTIKKQWNDEIIKFSDLDKLFHIDWTLDTKKKRYKVYQGIQEQEYGILITNYHSFLNDTDIIKDLNFDFVVLDEVHTIKCRTGVLNNNIAKVCQNKRTIFLTGTPIMSKPEDIFGIIKIANPQYFGNWNHFSNMYLTIDENTAYGSQIVGAKNLNQLRSLIQNILIRRTEYEVSIQLPKTIVKNITCQIDNTQTDILDAINVMNHNIISDLSDLKKQNGTTLAKNEEQYEKLTAVSKGLISLRQAASSDPRLFFQSHSKLTQNFTKLIPTSYKMSDKTENFLETLEDIIVSGHKVIVFTKYKMVTRMLKTDIEKKFKYKVLTYTGENDEDSRIFAVNNFWESDNYNILIGTDAMAEGVNLQCAKYVINYDLPDTAAIYIQRIGRIRRAASNYNHIVVYNFLTDNSKDISKMENIEKNLNTIGALVDIDEAQRHALIQASQLK